MTLQQATDRLMLGDMLFLHTPAEPHEKFYFFAPDFATVSLPIGRQLREIDGVVMLIKETPGHPDAPYFYWKHQDHVTKDEARSSGVLFCEHDRFDDAQALKEQLTHLFA